MRITPINLEDKIYPLNFSLAVSCMIHDEYGSMDKIEKIVEDKDAPISQKVDILCDVLSAMITSGCQYYNVFNKKPYNKAPVKNGEFVPLTSEQLKYCISPDEKTLKYIMDRINLCVNESQNRDLGTKPHKNSKKK